MAPAMEATWSWKSTAADFWNQHPVVFTQLLLLAVFIGYFAWTVIYNLYFHPLSIYPGPKLWAISNIPGALMNISGESGKRNLKLHAKYGSVIRLGPNWIDLGDPSDWHNLAGFRKPGQGIHEKDVRAFGPTRNAVIGATREDHTRYRKKLAGGFSAQTMHRQQPLLKEYADLLVNQIRKRSDGGATPLDMTAWFNWITFDIIGDLSFGKPFDGLATASYHPWISMLFEALKMIGIDAELKKFPIIHGFLQRLIPANTRRKVKQHYEMTAEKVKQRLELGVERPDFMEAMAKSTGKEAPLSMDEIISNANVLVTAGSETTATCLAAMTFFLCTNPEALDKLKQEIRSAFISEDEINFDSLAKLKYLRAVIEESLRMMPPAAMQSIRVINEYGDTVRGHRIPPGTEVSTHYWSIHQDPANWIMPEVFAPERWLGDKRFEGDNKLAFMPFSIGPRTCLGINLAYAELQLITSKILFNFDLRIDPSCRAWVDEARNFFNWEKKPLMIYYTPRDM